MKNVLLIVFGIICFFALVIGSSFFDLWHFGFFEPKKENIRREIFENTQSYNHGKIQDLAKYYEEYNKAESMQNKESIRQIIILRFAEFDETNINANKLRNFLIQMRGY